MKLYATTKNTGPSWNSDPTFLRYLGTSLSVAVTVVPANFKRYEKKEFPTQYPSIYAALPDEIQWKFVRYYAADGWWYSVVEFELT